MLKRLLPITAALALVNVASAAAIAFSETFDSTDFSVSFPAGGTSYTPVFSLPIEQFDPALGTLDSIAFAYVFTFHIDANTGASGGGLTASGGGDFLLSDGGGAFYNQGSGNGSGSGPNTNLSFDVTVGPESGALGNLGASGYVDFYLKGTESRIISWAPSFTLSPGETVTGTFELTSGTLSLTYNYTPIPEPSAFAAIAGLAVLAGAGARRPRRRAARGRDALPKPPA